MSRKQKVKDLIELALDERTPDKERIASAMKVCRVIKKYDLLDSPLDGVLDGLDSVDNETTQAVSSIARAVMGQSANIKKVIARARRRRQR